MKYWSYTLLLRVIGFIRFGVKEILWSQHWTPRWEMKLMRGLAGMLQTLTSRHLALSGGSTPTVFVGNQLVRVREHSRQRKLFGPLTWCLKRRRCIWTTDSNVSLLEWNRSCRVSQFYFIYGIVSKISYCSSPLLCILHNMKFIPYFFLHIMIIFSLNISKYIFLFRMSSRWNIVSKSSEWR